MKYKLVLISCDGYCFVYEEFDTEEQMKFWRAGYECDRDYKESQLLSKKDFDEWLEDPSKSYHRDLLDPFAESDKELKHSEDFVIRHLSHLFEGSK